MRARIPMMLVAVMSMMACAHVPWTGKYVAAPLKRQHASEERAVQALDAYFDAAKDLVAVSHTRTHDSCLEAFWAKGPQTSERRRMMSKDDVCSFLLKRFDQAANDLAGYGQAPSGKYPWLGEVFEYVLRTETIKSKQEKMASIDQYTIKKFEDLMSGQNSDIIPQIAKDYYVIRGTCCREVTVFDDWYKSHFSQIASR